MKINQKHRVLVLLACYNGYGLIDKQISSILNQESCSIKLLVSDDSSDDRTIEYLNNLVKSNKKITLIQNKSNIGFFKNFINLIMSCNLEKIDYVAYSDQDDIFLKNKFHESIMYLNEHNGDAISSSVRCFGNSQNVLHQSDNYSKFDFLFEGAGQGCTFVMKREPFQNFKNFLVSNSNHLKNIVFHDWLTYLFFRVKNYKWIFYNKPLTKYRIHNNNYLGNKFSLSGILFRINNLISFWYYDQILSMSKLARLINTDMPDLKKISIINFSKILIFHGRRKKTERTIIFFVIIFNHILSKVKKSIVVQ